MLAGVETNGLRTQAAAALCEWCKLFSLAEALISTLLENFDEEVRIADLKVSINH